MFFSLYVYEGSSQSSEESVVFVAVFEREPDFLGNVVWDRDTSVKCPNKTSCANLCVCVSVCFLAMLQAHWRISSHQDIPTGPGLGRVPGLSPACVLAEIITHTWSAAWSWSWSSSPFTLNFPALKLRLCSGLKPSLLHLCDQLNQKKEKRNPPKTFHQPNHDPRRLLLWFPPSCVSNTNWLRHPSIHPVRTPRTYSDIQIYPESRFLAELME